MEVLKLGTKRGNKEVPNAYEEGLVVGVKEELVKNEFIIN